MTTLILNILVLLQVSCTSQRSENFETIHSFIQQLGDEKVSYDSIMDSFLKLEFGSQDKKSQAKGAIFSIFKELRQAILKEGPANLTIMPYIQVKENEEVKRLQIPDNSDEDIFIIFSSKNKVVFPVLMKQGKIASFSTITKGDTRYFLMWN